MEMSLNKIFNRPSNQHFSRLFSHRAGTTADPSQDAAAVTEDEIETEFNDSECERRSIAFTNNSSIPTSLNPLDSGSDDYRFASGKLFFFLRMFFSVYFFFELSYRSTHSIHFCRFSQPKAI